MKEKLRGFLGFLGLVEDEYGEYGPSNAPRPFSEQSEEFEPEWASTPDAGRSRLSDAAGDRPVDRSGRPAPVTAGRDRRAYLGAGQRLERRLASATDRQPQRGRAISPFIDRA